MKTIARTTWPTLGAMAFLLTSQLQSPAQALLLSLDDFGVGNVLVTNTVQSTAGEPVEGVFGGRRSIFLTKEVESSATFISIGSGVLTWNQTGNDSSFVGYGSGSGDLSRYDALRVTVVSAPPNAGDIWMGLYYSVTNHPYSMTVLAPLPASGTGTIEVPLSSFLTRIAEQGWPPIDMTQVGGVSLLFWGGPPVNGRMTNGVYVFDNFQAIAYVPTPPLLVAGAQNWGGFQLLQLSWTNNGSRCKLEGSATLTGGWATVSSPWVTNANWVCTVVASPSPAQFYRLR